MKTFLSGVSLVVMSAVNVIIKRALPAILLWTVFCLLFSPGFSLAKVEEQDKGKETKAQDPLREARIDVFANPARPGSYKAVVFLRPHFQLEELTVSIRLVTELPPPAAS